MCSIFGQILKNSIDKNNFNKLVKHLEQRSTDSIWRIGYRTVAFYNYAYHTVAGFTEHDTFRSNQIREDQLIKEEAIELVEHEDRSRYQNIRWYLDTLGTDFKEVIKIVNNIPNIYREKNNESCIMHKQ